MNEQTLFKVGVFAIILDDQERVLWCLRNDMELWNLPGGALEGGETPQEGVIREVHEETGLEVEVVQLTGVYTNTQHDNISFTFLCKVIGGEITKTAETRDWKYYRNRETPANTSPAQVARVNDYFQERNHVHVEKHRHMSSRELLKNLGLL
ncbi:NUDIX domain-containing protein [Candidatus Nomurabacteria bacterium]|nr:NUDIX domain-containing protein [Candidatus Nomurabacteria bacterium]